MAISYSRNNTSGSLTNSWDTRFPLTAVDLWIPVQRVSDGWREVSSASKDSSIWGAVWGKAWGGSAVWHTKNDASDTWTKVN